MTHPNAEVAYFRVAAPYSRLRRELEAEGLDPSILDSHILSWRDSYRASLRDSKRICPQYSELEGDWLICFGDVFEIARFVEVRGKAAFVSLTSLQRGHKFIDNRGFSEHPGNIQIKGDRLYISGIPHSCIRRPDWGWILLGDNKLVNLYSFDPRFPPPRPAVPLMTPLMENYPSPLSIPELLRLEAHDEIHFTEIEFIPQAASEEVAQRDVDLMMIDAER